MLLLVDDETHILSALQRALRREGYRIVAAESVGAALELLAAQRVDLILSDQKMPGPSGVEFLEEAGRVQPDAARLLLTGWPEEVPAARARALGLRAVIPKPWDDAGLKATLRNVL